jgi:hypothetical protein
LEDIRQPLYPVGGSALALLVAGRQSTILWMDILRDIPQPCPSVEELASVVVEEWRLMVERRVHDGRQRDLSVGASVLVLVDE